MNCAFYNELVARALDNTLTHSIKQEQQIYTLQAFIADLQATIANLQATNENLSMENERLSTENVRLRSSNETLAANNSRLLAFVASSPSQDTVSQTVPEDGELSLKRPRIETPCSSEISGEYQAYSGEDGTNRLLTEYSDTSEPCTCPECTAQTVDYQFSFGEQQCLPDEDCMFLKALDA